MFPVAAFPLEADTEPCGDAVESSVRESGIVVRVAWLDYRMPAARVSTPRTSYAPDATLSCRSIAEPIVVGPSGVRVALGGTGRARPASPPPRPGRHCARRPGRRGLAAPRPPGPRVTSHRPRAGSHRPRPTGPAQKHGSRPVSDNHTNGPGTAFSLLAAPVEAFGRCSPARRRDARRPRRRTVCTAHAPATLRLVRGLRDTAAPPISQDPSCPIRAATPFDRARPGEPPHRNAPPLPRTPRPPGDAV